MIITPDIHKLLDMVLARFELGVPVGLEDAVAVRAAVKEALPDYQVEVYAPSNKQLNIGVGLSGVVLTTRSMVAL